MKRFLADIARRQPAFVELRFCEHGMTSVMAQKGRIDQSSSSFVSGVGVRALVDGAWGFSSTPSADGPSIQRAVDAAVEAGRELSRSRRTKTPALPPAALSDSDFTEPGLDDLSRRAIEEKIEKVLGIERALVRESPKIHTAVARYSEIFEHVVVASSDGACCSRRLARPELRAAAFAGGGAEQQCSGRGVGVTGGWKELFGHEGAGNIVERTAKEAVDLLGASYLDGGKRTVILDPGMVGLLCHEAVGHTVEADFVQSGSVAGRMLDKRVASDLVTLCDSGSPPFGGGPGGWLPFDDEGVPCGVTTIIDRGMLRNYLHDRESANHFGAEPRGNARAWSYGDEPIIRMTNTYLLPGESTLEEMLAATDGGLFISGAGGGQADANGEFMFGAVCAYDIRGGRLGRMYRDVTLSGMAFETLKTVDMVSREFHWDMGSGYCSKGQMAKVDAGGPYLRCQVLVGGRQKT